MGRLAHRRVVHMQAAVDTPHHHVPRMEPDADLHRHAVRALHLVAIPRHRLLHVQGRITRAHGMIFMGDRRAKQGHDAIAHDLIHGALVAVHGLHHAFEHGIENRARLLRVAVGQQLHGAFEVGKQHGDLLALAFQGTFGGEDLLGEIGRGVGEWRLGREHRGSCGTCGSRVKVAGPDQAPTRVVGHLRLRVEEFVFQGGELLVIQGELDLQRAIGDTAALAQQSERLIHHRNKVHPVSSLPGTRPLYSCATPS
jgi:hypothetical protein